MQNAAAKGKSTEELNDIKLHKCECLQCSTSSQMFKSYCQMCYILPLSLNPKTETSPILQDAAAKGKSTEELNDIKLHKCECPPCFTEFMNNGQMECVPKCDLNHCDEPTGICNIAVPTSGTPFSHSEDTSF